MPENNQSTGQSRNLPSTTSTITEMKMNGTTCTGAADTAAEGQYHQMRLRQEEEEPEPEEHHHHVSLAFPRSRKMTKRRMLTTEKKSFNVGLSSLVWLLLSFVSALKFNPSCCMGASSSSSPTSSSSLSPSRSRITNVNHKSMPRNKFGIISKTTTTNKLFPKTMLLLSSSSLLSGSGERRTSNVILGGDLSSILNDFPRGGGEGDGNENENEDEGDTGATNIKNKKSGSKSSKKKTAKAKSSSSSTSGGTGSKKTKSNKKKKKPKSETTASSSTSDSTKKAIDKAMQENKDAAQAMGDAIRYDKIVVINNVIMFFVVTRNEKVN